MHRRRGLDYALRPKWDLKCRFLAILIGRIAPIPVIQEPWPLILSRWVGCLPLRLTASRCQDVVAVEAAATQMQEPSTPSAFYHDPKLPVRQRTSASGKRRCSIVPPAWVASRMTARGRFLLDCFRAKFGTALLSTGFACFRQHHAARKALSSARAKTDKWVSCGYNAPRSQVRHRCEFSTQSAIWAEPSICRSPSE
jgi:hypothetical protein